MELGQEGVVDHGKRSWGRGVVVDGTWGRCKERTMVDGAGGEKQW